MTKSFITNNPAIDMTIVGFGQAGSRIADEFASFKKSDGTPIYNCLALNSNDGDLEGLQYITESNRVSLKLGGLGKNPEKAMRVLEENKDAKEILKQFIHEKVRSNDQLVLFFAGLGGGTGTATIVKAISEFYDYHNKPLIKEELLAIKEKVGDQEFKANGKKYLSQAMKQATERFVKIGVIATLPLRNDGPEVLRQVSDFSKEIWKMANDPTKGIAFVTFADNQHFHDEFKEIPVKQRDGVDNYRDYANKQIANIFHELNTATTSGGSTVVFDSEDFKRAITEHTGSLVFSKIEVPTNVVHDSKSVSQLFERSLKTNSFHSPIQLISEEDGKRISKKVHHVGLLAVLDEKKSYGNGAFIEDAKEIAHEILPINGVVFDGYIQAKNDFSVTVYTFYKTDALPERLETGLVKEYEDFIQRNREVNYEKSTISTISQEDDAFADLDIDLDDLGISDLFDDSPSTPEEKQKEDSDKHLEDLLSTLNTD